MAHTGFGKGGLGAEPPVATDFYVFCKKNTHFSVVFLSKSGLNPPLLALLVDLRYSISIFVCRLVVTENISGGQLPLLPPLATPLVKVVYLIGFFLPRLMKTQVLQRRNQTIILQLVAIRPAAGCDSFIYLFALDTKSGLKHC